MLPAAMPSFSARGKGDAWRALLIPIAADESFDLGLLAVAAFIFTILGVSGVSGITDLASVILALGWGVDLGNATTVGRARRWCRALTQCKRSRVCGSAEFQDCRGGPCGARH